MRKGRPSGCVSASLVPAITTTRGPATASRSGPECDRRCLRRAECVRPALLFADAAKRDGDDARAQPFELGASPYNFLQVNESERQASFFYTGGLMAVHSQGRDRRAIWDAIERREVYATSGERMLLWFDLLDAGARIPMGSIVERGEAPTFEVRALGAFEQLDGCPQSAIDALGTDRLQQLSGGECYHPSNQRKPIERIEVVRIRPQVAPLIKKPLRR